MQHNHIPGNFGILYKPLIVELHKKFNFVPKGYLLPRDNEILRAEVSMCCKVVVIVKYDGLTKKVSKKEKMLPLNPHDYRKYSRHKYCGVSLSCVTRRH